MAHGEGYYDSTYTDAAGSFTLPHVPAGTVALEATTSFRQGLSAGIRLDIPENSAGTIDVEIEFGGQSELAGLVSRAGQPAASVLISATPVLPSVTTRGRTESESDGSYRIEGLNDGRYHLVFSGPFGLYRLTADVDGRSRLDVDLPSGSIVGTVTDSVSRAGVADAVITATSGRERSPSDVNRGVADSTGQYTLPNLDPGTYQVRATRSGYQQETQIVTIQQGEQRRDFELQPRSGTRLRIVDGMKGVPVSRARVRVTAQGAIAFEETLVLDSGGRGELPAMAPGSYVLSVVVAGYAPRSLSIQTPAPAIDVSVEPGGRLQLRLPASTSNRVRLLDAGGIAQAVAGSDAAGWTSIAGPTTVWMNVAAGSYRLESRTGSVTPVVVRSGLTSVVDVK